MRVERFGDGYFGDGVAFGDGCFEGDMEFCRMLKNFRDFGLSDL